MELSFLDCIHKSAIWGIVIYSKTVICYCNIFYILWYCLEHIFFYNPHSYISILKPGLRRNLDMNHIQDCTGSGLFWEIFSISPQRNRNVILTNILNYDLFSTNILVREKLKKSEIYLVSRFWYIARFLAGVLKTQYKFLDHYHNFFKSCTFSVYGRGDWTEFHKGS